MNSKRKRGSEDGGSLPYLLLLIVIAVVAWYLFTTSRNAQLAKEAENAEPELIATPEPDTFRPATPAPVARATPTPAPIAVATPAPPPPEPPPLDLATVAATRALWPAQVALLQPVAFPIIFNGRVAGEAKIPAGSTLRLLQVQGDKVEVEYQTSKHLIPATSTDLMPRAKLAYDKAGNLPLASAAPATAPMTTAPLATPEPGPSAGVPKKLAERLTIEVVRMKRSRVEGGDWDDKKDRIELKVKVTNSDTVLSANLLKAEIFILGESILDRSSVLILGREKFEFPMPVRGSFEYVTPQVVTAYDTTGARFGHKYEGWFLRIVDDKGAIVVEKSNLPTLLKNGDKLFALGVGQSYDRVSIQAR